MGALADFVVASLLVSLRLVPTLGFAQPFTLLRVPAIVRLVLALSLAAFMVAGNSGQIDTDHWQNRLIAVIATELLIGVTIALSLQLAFAALLTAGRTIDLQAGFGFALLADPSNRSQLPLIGTVFVYAAAAIFFATEGPSDLLAIWAQSLETLPLGSGMSDGAVAALLTFMSAAFVLAFGAGGVILLVLFLIDIAIALMSRTLPQMNVLFLGFSAKSLVTLIVLPVAIAGSAAIFLRIVRLSLETMLALV